jgi:ribonuclease P protein component
MKEPSATPGQVKPSSAAKRKFPKTSRILRSAEFRHIYENGFRVSSPLFAAFCFERPPTGPPTSHSMGPRLGLTVPRAVGGAVERNRIKRRLREAFRLHRDRLGERWDLVLNPRRSMLAASFPEVERALAKVIERCKTAKV